MRSKPVAFGRICTIASPWCRWPCRHCASATGDIVALAAHFLDYYSTKFDKTCGPFTPAALAGAGNLPLGGQCAPAPALHRAGGRTSCRAARSIRCTCSRRRAFDQPAVADEGAQAAALRYQDARAEFERDYLRRLLDAAGGNVSEAARLSGIPRQNLYVTHEAMGICHLKVTVCHLFSDSRIAVNLPESPPAVSGAEPEELMRGTRLARTDVADLGNYPEVNEYRSGKSVSETLLVRQSILDR